MKEDFTSQVIKLGDARAQLKITIPNYIVTKTFNAVYQNIARQVNVLGYRPSKVPKQMVLEKIGGQKALQEEVRSALINYYYPKALEKHQLTPINAKFSSKLPLEGKDYVFDVDIELYPLVVLPKLEDIVLETKVEQVTEEVFNQNIESLRMQNALYVPVDNQAAKAKDIVYLQWLEDPDENILLIDLQTVQDGIIQQLEGRNIGEVFNFTLPPNFLEDLSKASNLFDNLPFLSSRVVVKDIKACVLPKSNEDLAKTLGFELWAEVEKDLFDTLQMRFDEQGFQAQKDELLEKLVAKTKTQPPEVFIEHHKEFLLDELAYELDQEGKSLEEHFNDLRKKNRYRDFVIQLEEEASMQAKRDLVLEAIVREQKINLNEEEFTNSLQRIADSEGSTISEFKESRGQDWLGNYHFFLTCEKALSEMVKEIT